MNTEELLKKQYKNLYSEMSAPESWKGQVTDMINREALTEKMAYNMKKPWYKRRAAIFTFALIMILGAALTYAGVSGKWGRTLEDLLGADETKIRQMRDQGLLTGMDEDDPQAQPITINGVTVTPKMLLTDGKVAYLSFLVQGYDIADDDIPRFQLPETRVSYAEDEDWTQAFSCSQMFYSGLVAQDYLAGSMPVYVDGSEPETRADGSPIGRYKEEDGSLEFIFILTMASLEDENGNLLEDTFFGKKVHAVMCNLNTGQEGHGADAVLENAVYGSWEFDLVLPDAQDSILLKSEPMDLHSESTGCIIQGITISPLSVEICYELPEDAETDPSVLKRQHRVENMIDLTGIILKDGTVLRGIMQGGSALSSENKFWIQITLNRIIDPAEVDALQIRFYNMGVEGTTFSEEEIIPFISVN